MSGDALRSIASSIRRLLWRSMQHSQTFGSDDIRRQLILGSSVVLLLVGGFGCWAATASLAGAVLAFGNIVVDTNVKKVQHPSGGIVGEIRVRDGDRVVAGEILMRLDDTIVRANLGIVTSQLNELAVRKSRLRAERDSADEIVLPPSLADRTSADDVEVLLREERALFGSRRESRAGQKAQLRERIEQITQEIAGLTGQHGAKAKEISLIERELREVEKLWGKSLVSLTKLTALQRDATRIQGESAQLLAAIARSKGRITETELQILQIDQDLRAEVSKELREVMAKEAELTDRRLAAEDQLRRIDIRAPQSGIVHQLSVHTVGGVVTPTETLMLIVPQGDALIVEVKIAPQDIDHVRAGQPVFLRLTAFSQRTTPELAGEVVLVAADLSREQPGGPAYFVARIGLKDGEIGRLGALKLVPGMPAEAYIRTGDRTALSYLMKPLTDQFTRAFIER